jgi:hypothetical protein
VELDVGVKLRGWRFRTDRERRGALIFLHGLSNNRGSVVGLVPRFLDRGFDVVAFDSRAHGESGGDACTYGYFEKHDLSRIIDDVGPGVVVLFGTSMGAAIALQAAAHDARIMAVIAVATISDLRTAARERAPFFASRGNVDAALRIAEESARFKVDDVSPVALAPKIRAAVFLVHGARDPETPAAHSRRVHDALPGPKRLVVVPGAGHNDAMTSEIWADVERWLDGIVAGRPEGRSPSHDPSGGSGGGRGIRGGGL